MVSVRKWQLGIGLIGVVALGLSREAASLDAQCDLARTEYAPLEVIEPCTALLQSQGLSQRQREDALFARGRAYHRAFHLSAALADYNRVLELAPRNVDALLVRSNAHLRLKHRKAYESDVLQAAAISPESASVLRAMGVLAHNSGNRDHALLFYTKALQADPAEPFALLFRARLYARARRFEEALADLGALARVTAGQRLGYLDDDALTDFHATALVERARIFEASGDNARAEQDFN